MRLLAVVSLSAQRLTNGLPTSAATGNYYSLLKGISIGFFVPFLPLFFFRTQLFTKRTQMAIVLGIIINLGFGFLRLIG